MPDQEFSNYVGANEVAVVSPGLLLDGRPEVPLGSASIYQGVGGATGVMATGSALREAQVPTDLPVVGELALVTFPSVASPNTPLVRTITMTGPLIVGLTPPAGLVAGRVTDFLLIVTNTSGVTQSIYLEDEVSGRVPMYFDEAHASARPTIAAGQTVQLHLRYIPSPERAILRALPTTGSARRRRPVLVGFDPSNSGEASQVTAQLAGDLLIEITQRAGGSSLAGLRSGFTQIPGVSGIIGTDLAWRGSYRFATADAESAAGPSPTVTRSAMLAFRHVDPTSPFADIDQASGTGLDGSIPALTPDDPIYPCVPLVAIIGRYLTGSGTWALPAGYTSAGTAEVSTASLVRTGLSDPVINKPAQAFTTPSAAHAWASVALLLRGVAL